MSELTLYQPRDYNGLKDLAVLVVKSSLCNVRTPEDALVIMMTGAELGLSVMQSLRGIHVVKGRPVLSADLMGAVVARSPACEYLRVLEMTAEACTIETKRAGHPEPTRMTWTMEDAKRAKLGGDNWSKYPAAMLRARVTAQLCRAVYPDLLLGLYTPDELEAAEEPVQAEVVKMDVVEAEVVEGDDEERSLHKRLCEELFSVAKASTNKDDAVAFCKHVAAEHGASLLRELKPKHVGPVLQHLEAMSIDERRDYIRGELIAAA